MFFFLVVGTKCAVELHLDICLTAIFISNNPSNDGLCILGFASYKKSWFVFFQISYDADKCF